MISGIVVDLFSGGKVLPQLQEVCISLFYMKGWDLAFDMVPWSLIFPVQKFSNTVKCCFKFKFVKSFNHLFNC